MVVYKRFFLKFVFENFLREKKMNVFDFQTPLPPDKPLKATTNAKIQIYLWLGIEEYEPYIFKQLPSGFEMPPLPMNPDNKYIRYDG